MAHLENLLDKLPPVPGRQGFGFNRQVDASVYQGFAWLPKISIITPSYNQGHFLEETLRSILLQNYPNLELIVIDGGSTDNSVEVIKKYESHITYWESAKDKGTYDANNKGLTRMTGDYWCVVNSDDTLTGNSLLYVVEALNQQAADWLTGGIYVINEASEAKAKIHPLAPQPVGGYSFGHSCWIFHASTFLSARVYKEIGMFIKHDLMDYEYWMRMEAKGYQPVVLPQVLSTLRFHADSKSYSYLKIMRQNHSLIATYKETLSPRLNEGQKHEFDARLQEWDITYFKNKALYEAGEGKKAAAFKEYAGLAAKYPAVLGQRWYWGAIRQLLSGKQQGLNHLNFLSNPTIEVE